MTSPSQPDSSIGNESFATLSIDYKVSKQDLIVIRRTDWDRIHGNVKKLTNPAPFLSQVGWSAATTGAGALVSLAAWIPAYGQLPAKAQTSYDWITPALAILGILLIIGALICWGLNRRIVKFEQVAVDSVIKDMDACAKLTERQDTSESIDTPSKQDVVSSSYPLIDTSVFLGAVLNQMSLRKSYSVQAEEDALQAARNAAYADAARQEAAQNTYEVPDDDSRP